MQRASFTRFVTSAKSNLLRIGCVAMPSTSSTASAYLRLQTEAFSHRKDLVCNSLASEAGSSQVCSKESGILSLFAHTSAICVPLLGELEFAGPEVGVALLLQHRAATSRQ